MRAIALVATALGAFLYPPPKQVVIEHTAIHQFEDGPDLAPDFRFASGETVYFDFEIGGYQRSEDDKLDLRWKVEAQDSSGIALVPPQSGKIAAELAPEDKKWKPKGRAQIEIPPHALTGSYKILITVDDALAKTAAQRDFTIQVHGRAVQPAESLELRNPGFYRSEDEPKPLAVAAYRPGDAVWIRFDIVGFQLGAANRYDVDYGLSVLRANGESLFSQPEAAAERGDSFYPRRYVPAGLSLNLQKDISPGRYTVVVTAHDRVGKQQAELRQTFSVE